MEKTMKLFEMRVTNFMNTHDGTFKFFDKTMVSARNGVGKSTLINAYMWLMFDTDAELHSNPSVRRIIDGEPVKNITSLSIPIPLPPAGGIPYSKAST